LSSVVQQLAEKKLITAPKFLPGSMCYETIMGSVAYRVASDTSDVDVYGFAVPPRDLVFPHLAGEIPGFGRQIKRFEQFQEHHIVDRDALGGQGAQAPPGRQYDLQIFSIVKFFQLAMENNPNIIDSLFTPVRCVLHSTRIGTLVRERRRDFLHKGAWFKFKGYAYGTLNKLGTTARPELVRFEEEQGIPHGTTLESVEAEMRKRGLLDDRGRPTS
jgi:hypothetical protein